MHLWVNDHKTKPASASFDQTVDPVATMTGIAL